MVDRWLIRPATAADVPAIAAAEIRCFSDPWSEEGIGALFENESLCALAGEPADAKSGIAGYLFARSIAGEAEILNVAVLPEERGQGLGGRLLDRALVALESQAVGAVFLEVRESNQPARALYLSRGFQQVGFRADYYRKPRENALILRRELPPGSF